MGVCQSSGKVVQPQKVDESVPVEESKEESVPVEESKEAIGGVPVPVL
jgi:hypothetical protein